MKLRVSMMALILLLLLCIGCLTACGGQVPPNGEDPGGTVAPPGGTEDPPVYHVTQLSEMGDIEKGYFGKTDASSLLIDLSTYFTFEASDVTVTAQSADPSVATAQILRDAQGDYQLKLTACKSGGQTDIIVKVASTLADVCLEQTFAFKTRAYRKIACVGDSLTYGHSWPQEAYPVYLSELMGFDVKNFGYNGASVTGYNPPLNLNYTAQSVYQQSIDYDADVLILMLGTNDSKGWADAVDLFKDAYVSLINSYRAQNPDIKIILVSAPPTMQNNKFSIPSDVITSSIVPIQRQVASELSLPLIDFCDLFLSSPDPEAAMAAYIRGDAATDGVHLTPEGARCLAELIAAKIRSF